MLELMTSKLCSFFIFNPLAIALFIFCIEKIMNSNDEKAWLKQTTTYRSIS